MAIKSLQVFNIGSVTTDKSMMTFMRDQGKQIESPFFSYLIRADEGNILVDTGMHPDDAAASFKMKGIPFPWKQEEYLPEQLKSAGLSFNDINMVVMTHLHPDHVGWLKAIPNAEVIVQKREFLLNREPPTKKGSIAERYSDLEKLKWKLVDGDNVIFPGLAVIFTPGHSPGHQSVMLDMPKSGVIILTGDACFLKENFDQECVPAPFDSARDALLSIKKLKLWAQIRNATIIPGHDAENYRLQVKKSPEVYT